MIKALFIFILLQSIALNQSLTNSQLDAIKANLQSGTTEVDSDVVTDVADLSPKKVTIDTPDIDSSMEIPFGYDYFLREISFFDNIPTPENFKLGSGDQIVLSMWGERNSQETFTISKDGSIFYNNIGFINLSNQTISEAEQTLIKVLSKTFSTLKDNENPTSLRLSLGQSNSVNVFLTGYSNNPGVHLIHPFADIYAALTQSGGVDYNGSLRNIELIRSGKVIDTVDFYSFFLKGNNTFSNMRLMDGDIIHIPKSGHSVKISGAVQRPGIYELNSEENLENLIDYASGISVNAQSKAVVEFVKPIDARISDDVPNYSKFIDLNKDINMKIGEVVSINILSTSNSSDKVLVQGTVKFSGRYPATNLKEVLDVAGGFNDPIFLNKIRQDEITVLRKDASMIYSKEYILSYNDSENFTLIPEDIVLVYGNSNYRDPITIEVTGEVNKAGPYIFKKGMTVIDAINSADGVTPFADISATELFNRDTGTKINNISLNTPIPSSAQINIPKLDNSVSISGAVYSPRTVVFTKNKSLESYLKSAGGATKDAKIRDIQIVKSNGNIKKVSTIFGRSFANIDPNDQIIVPLKKEKSFDPVSLTSNIVSVLTNLATIIFIIDSQ
mgnify:CR=1 FL=1|tara:strand:+ start:3187 stop:5031 length:1845 start_codon:yes stop_codon:yes gene_type:complete